MIPKDTPIFPTLWTHST